MNALWSSLAIAACLTVAYPQEATAWGPDGHRIVCRIAFQFLAYQDEVRDDVAQRLQQAGARLADLLRRQLVLPS